MFKFYIKSIIFILLVVFTISILDSYVTHDELLHHAISKLEDEKYEYDFVYMGNSLSRRSYNAPEIDSSLNTKSVNLASEAQHFFITHALFNKIIRRETSRPKKLFIITISPWQFKELRSEKWWSHLQMASLDGLGMSYDKLRLMNYFFEVKDFPKVLSTSVRFHGNFAEGIIETNDKNELFEKTKENGFVLNIKSKLNDKQRLEKKDLLQIANQYPRNIENAQAKKISDTAEIILKDIVSKCKNNNVELLFITPPAINMLYNESEYGKMKYFERLFKSLNVDYLNMNYFFNDLNLTYDDYNDYQHLNHFGNKKITPFLINYISERTNTKLKSTANSSTKENYKEVLQQNTDANNESFADNSPFQLNQKNILTKSVDKVSNEKDDGVMILRDNIEASSFMYTNDISSKQGEEVEISIRVRKTETDNLLGMRIQGKYPSRVDAVFDISKGEVKGVKKAGLFSNEQATIRRIDDFWFECTLRGKVDTDKIKIILGPTKPDKSILGWEGETNEECSIVIIPNSLKVEHR
ncbi:MAG: hypothetical protein KDC81_15070 [Flavobacteriaceae bacterium]|nr:hypothetical protein [Flavobacteriaceae bacterium]